MEDPLQPYSRQPPRLVYLCGLSDTLRRDFCRYFRESIDDCEVLFSMDINDFRNDQGRQINAHIFELYLPGKGLQDLSGTTSSTGNNTLKPEGTNDLDPRYSPNGQKIIFTNVINDDKSTPSLYKADLSGKSREKIISNAEMGFWRQQ